MKAILPLLAAFTVGCANGFHRDALQERLHDGSLQSTDKDIAAARALRPQLKFPCRVACYLNPESKGGNWHWTQDDRAALETVGAELKTKGIASEVLLLPDMLSEKGSLDKLRLAAAKCGADVLLVVNGAAECDKYKNPAAVFDLTVVGGYLVPSRHVDALFLMEGCLFDVDNGYVYGAVQAEGVGKIVRPTFRTEEKDAIAKAKTQAIGRLNDELLKTMTAIAKSPTTGTIPAVPPVGQVLSFEP
jgi:rhombotail lipoprotein